MGPTFKDSDKKEYASFLRISYMLINNINRSDSTLFHILIIISKSVDRT